MVLVLVYVVWGIIWGAATNAVIGNKGYSENWFWWGFFFGFIAFLVACTKPECRGYSNYSAYSYSDTLNYLQGKPSETARQANGSWVCGSCNTVNPSYVGTCRCGRNKSDNDMVSQWAKNVSNKQENIGLINQKEIKTMSEMDKADAILKYKNLLDAQVITEEEFNKKKAELLGSEIDTEPKRQEHTKAEEMILNVLAKNIDGISPVVLLQMIPRSVSQKEVSDALKHLQDINVIQKRDGKVYINK